MTKNILVIFIFSFLYTSFVYSSDHLPKVTANIGLTEVNDIEMGTSICIDCDKLKEQFGAINDILSKYSEGSTNKELLEISEKFNSNFQLIKYYSSKQSNTHCSNTQDTEQRKTNFPSEINLDLDGADIKLGENIKLPYKLTFTDGEVKTFFYQGNLLGKDVMVRLDLFSDGHNKVSYYDISKSYSVEKSSIDDFKQLIASGHKVQSIKQFDNKDMLAKLINSKGEVIITKVNIQDLTKHYESIDNSLQTEISSNITKKYSDPNVKIENSNKISNMGAMKVEQSGASRKSKYGNLNINSDLSFQKSGNNLSSSEMLIAQLEARFKSQHVDINAAGKIVERKTDGMVMIQDPLFAQFSTPYEILKNPFVDNSFNGSESHLGAQVVLRATDNLTITGEAVATSIKADNTKTTKDFSQVFIKAELEKEDGTYFISAENLDNQELNFYQNKLTLGMSKKIDENTFSIKTAVQQDSDKKNSHDLLIGLVNTDKNVTKSASLLLSTSDESKSFVLSGSLSQKGRINYMGRIYHTENSFTQNMSGASISITNLNNDVDDFPVDSVNASVTKSGKDFSYQSGISLDITAKKNLGFDCEWGDIDNGCSISIRQKTDFGAVTVQAGKHKKRGTSVSLQVELLRWN